MTAPIDYSLVADLAEADPTLTKRQLAIRMNCSEATIRRALRFHEVDAAKQLRARRFKAEFDDPLVAEFFRIHNAGRNDDATIAREAGLGPDFVSRLRRGAATSPRAINLNKLLRVYGYQLKIERIEE